MLKMSGDSEEEHFFDMFTAFCEWNTGMSAQLKEHIEDCAECLRDFMRHFYKADIKGSKQATCQYTQVIFEDLNRVFDHLKSKKERGERYFKGDSRFPGTEDLPKPKMTVYRKLKSETKEDCVKRIEYCTRALGELTCLKGLFDKAFELDSDLSAESKRKSRERKARARYVANMGKAFREKVSERRRQWLDNQLNKEKAIKAAPLIQERHPHIKYGPLDNMKRFQSPVLKLFPPREERISAPSILKDPSKKTSNKNVEKTVSFSSVVKTLDENGTTSNELVSDSQSEDWRKRFSKCPARLKNDQLPPSNK